MFSGEYVSMVSDLLNRTDDSYDMALFDTSLSHFESQVTCCQSIQRWRAECSGDRGQDYSRDVYITGWHD